ncbi:expressed unknown protein [Seminavis robusta]|uniref:Uncharacterized protein n=1 Tax=Seminavis robusta TaxID=568900 RepID=A0A9N8HUB3_9STRA|nr:expressed unknown protein [Seminavis robusta]|eukprot:Sro2030_g311800.1 n/a (364) ;mRNA; f:14209-15487
MEDQLLLPTVYYMISSPVCLVASALSAFAVILLVTNHARPLSNEIFLSYSHVISSLRSGLRRGKPPLFLRNRFLHTEESKETKDQALGNITVDFYRVYEEKQILGFSYRQYIISQWRLERQVDFLNYWYEGRVNFFMGDVYPFEDPDFSGEVNCATQVLDFSSSSEIRNVSRISALYVKKLSNNLNGCAPFDVPLGGLGPFAPVAMIGMSSDSFLFSSNLGLQNIAGATITHEIGHVMGFRHTAQAAENVASYVSCFDLLRYPQFDQTSTASTIFNSAVLREDKIWDDQTGELYEYDDWKGRTNVMAPLRLYHVLAPWEIRLFNKGYKNVFQDIVRCWFLQAAEGFKNETTSDQLPTPPEIEY